MSLSNFYEIGFHITHENTPNVSVNRLTERVIIRAIQALKQYD